MTAAIALPNPGTSLTPSAQLTACADGRESEGAAFADLLAALVQSSATTIQHNYPAPPQGSRSASAMAPRREALHELRAAEFSETGVFGLMAASALVSSAEDIAVRTQQVGASLKDCARRPPQQTPPRAVALCRVPLGASRVSATNTPDVSPQQRFQVHPIAHSRARPQDIVIDARPASLPVQRQVESRSPARILVPCTAPRTLLFASGQMSAVHVAITAAEHGLSVFARVGRMEPTERARLRHAAALLLAEHGHHGASVILDTNSADAKGG